MSPRAMASLPATLLAMALALLLAGCSGGNSSKDNLPGGEYSGIGAAGDRVVIDINGDGVRVNGNETKLDDPTTNAGFRFSDNGVTEDWSCDNTDWVHSIHCTVTRTTKLSAKGVCPPAGAVTPTPSASARPSPSSSLVGNGFSSVSSGLTQSGVASPSPSAIAQPVIAVPTQCAIALPTTETIDLYHLCTTAPCAKPNQ